jgi:cytochrome c oxidase subunit 4
MKTLLPALRDAADRAWLVLAAATGFTLWLGESQAGHPMGVLPATLVLGLAALKGWLVIDEFMGLRRAPPLWRCLLLGWLVAVCGLIGALHLASAPA